VLHITNGDSVIEGFRAAALPGTYLPWRDPLHDGPVPQLPSLEALSDIRARSLATGGHAYEEIRASFAERDRTLAAFRDHDETVLWFEHDLYDQLQLIQVLHWLSTQDLPGVRLSVIQIGDHPDLVPFYGLGQLDGRQLLQLFPTRAPVSVRQLEIGREAWEAFCAPDPTALVAVASRAEPEMPFLGAALQRFLEEYPSVRDGLSRTERQLLAAGEAGARDRRDYYLKSQASECCPWGDLSVYSRLDGLAASPSPALDRLGPDELAINRLGRRLLAGDDDWIGSRSGIDLWLGGVHLTGINVWRWSEGTLWLT
jgi:hypothetical protein